MGELVDGSFQAIDLNLGCVQAMAFGEPTRSDLDGLLLGLANTDAFVFNTVSGRAMSDLEVFEERQAQLERQQAASEAEARSHQLALQRAFEEARSAEWSARRGEFYELIDANTWGAPVREFLDELEFSHYSFERDYYDKYGIHSWDELRWAQNAGLDNATTRAAAEKLLGRDLAQRARDASITDEPVGFSWDAVFDTWHINNRNRKTKTEVFETRHGVRIVTYD